jgi:hypothetical protein
VIERYLLLGLRLGKHVDGFVDAYFGPRELAEQVEPEQPADPPELAEEASALLGLVDEGRLGEQRASWLRAQLVGLETVARRLAGERISWLEEVERCHGVRPHLTSEEQFEEGHRLLDETFGDTAGYQRWLDSQVVPVEKLLPAAELLCAESRRRTLALFGLPDGEEATLEVVANEPWSAFNYYDGSLRSRVVINTDLPIWSYVLPTLVAHELYPGHHTEHAWKEQGLVRERGVLEESILLTGTPQSLVSEGIAENAAETVFGTDLHREAAELLRPLDLAYDADGAEALRQAADLLDPVRDNMAYQLNEEGRPREEVVEYGMRWRRLPRERIEKMLDFVTDPTWRAYSACYTHGEKLVRAHVGGDGERYRRLLTEQVTTADLIS